VRLPGAIDGDRTQAACPADAGHTLFGHPRAVPEASSNAQSETVEQSHRFLAWPAYSMAAILIAYPAAEAFLSLMPWQLGITAWRFGAAGLLSRALMTPMLGLLMLAGLAVLFEHRRLLRVLSVASLVFGVVLILVLGTFLLDALQMRGQIRPDLKRAFDVASLQAAAKFGISAVWLGLLALGGIRAARRGRPERRSERRSAPIMAAAVSGSHSAE
jgi:hypothetical protein